MEHVTDPSLNKLLYSLMAAGLIQSIALVAVLIKYIWGSNKNEMHDFKLALAENVKATNQNTLAITKLMVTLEGVEEKLDIVGELRRDVDRMGSKLRGKPS